MVGEGTWGVSPSSVIYWMCKSCFSIDLMSMMFSCVDHRVRKPGFFRKNYRNYVSFLSFLSLGIVSTNYGLGL